ncbi:uncharacterized protein MONBRDRAFT_31097 [Monosiga brevicollis MX1]|uniref:Uncharacterized protein n=1 Tax=Monosiga brevicollis TaxID=81824 RepID=A9URP7_MONBE|nr:uncharacterized protein MONBRDRAFT_31097 [Monosiga brevicollis MX1]EDQ91963.1 predicted protein [Monosiga brevicollis MX1]|eukprot:XP_001743249.1 hypothetical protein [Monosiga brevicollis MX1]
MTTLEEVQNRRRDENYIDTEQIDFKGLNNDYSAERFGACSKQSLRRYLITPDEVASVIKDFSPLVWLSLILTVVFVFICDRYDILWNVEVAIVIGPLVFPLAFSINASYQRRERVLEDLASLKSALADMYWCHRDLTLNTNVGDGHDEQVRETIENIMDTLLKYLIHQSRINREEKLRRLYRLLSRLSRANVVVLRSDLPGASPLVANMFRMHQEIATRLERLRSIREYLTPRSIRNFFKVFVFLVPLVLAPYFVATARETDTGSSMWSAYFSAVVVTLLFGALQSVQDGLDDPFDGVGEDDVSLFELSRWPKVALWKTSNLMADSLVAPNRGTTMQALRDFFSMKRVDPEQAKPEDVVIKAKKRSGCCGCFTPVVEEDEDRISVCTAQSSAAEDDVYDAQLSILCEQSSMGNTPDRMAAASVRAQEWLIAQQASVPNSGSAVPERPSPLGNHVRARPKSVPVPVHPSNITTLGHDAKSQLGQTPPYPVGSAIAAATLTPGSNTSPGSAFDQAPGSAPAHLSGEVDGKPGKVPPPPPLNMGHPAHHRLTSIAERSSSSSSQADVMRRPSILSVQSLDEALANTPPPPLSNDREPRRVSWRGRLTDTQPSTESDPPVPRKVSDVPSMISQVPTTPGMLMVSPDYASGAPPFPVPVSTSDTSDFAFAEMEAVAREHAQDMAPGPPYPPPPVSRSIESALNHSTNSVIVQKLRSLKSSHHSPSNSGHSHSEGQRESHSRSEPPMDIRHIVEQSKSQGLDEMSILRELLPAGNAALDDRVFAQERYDRHRSGSNVTVPSHSDADTGLAGQAMLHLSVSNNYADSSAMSQGRESPSGPVASEGDHEPTNSAGSIPLAAPRPPNALRASDEMRGPWGSKRGSSEHAYVELSPSMPRASMLSMSMMAGDSPTRMTRVSSGEASVAATASRHASVTVPAASNMGDDEVVESLEFSDRGSLKRRHPNSRLASEVGAEDTPVGPLTAAALAAADTSENPPASTDALASPSTRSPPLRHDNTYL